jgi:hypothetical protein
MHVVIGLHKLFKAKKAYKRGVSRREDKWYRGGDQEGSDVNVMGYREEGGGAGGRMGRCDVLACRMKRLVRKLWGNGGITYHIHGHRPLGAMGEE